MSGGRLQLRIILSLLAAMLANTAALAVPKPWGFVIIGAVLAGVLAWWLIPRNRWTSFETPPGWTFRASDPAFTPPAKPALAEPQGEVRNVLRGEFDGWPLVAWEEKVGPQFAWRCALDVGIDLPSWFARPLRELVGPQDKVAFTDLYEYSPAMHPELKKVMAARPTSLAWRTSGTQIVAEVAAMGPNQLKKWLATEGRLLAELAAVLRTELTTQQLRLAPSTPTPALTQGGPARNVWTPEDVDVDPVPESTGWSQPDFAKPSGRADKAPLARRAPMDRG